VWAVDEVTDAIKGDGIEIYLHAAPVRIAYASSWSGSQQQDIYVPSPHFRAQAIPWDETPDEVLHLGCTITSGKNNQDVHVALLEKPSPLLEPNPLANVQIAGEGWTVLLRHSTFLKEMRVINVVYDSVIGQAAINHMREEQEHAAKKEHAAKNAKRQAQSKSKNNSNSKKDNSGNDKSSSSSSS
jgi:hypothetical protein